MYLNHSSPPFCPITPTRPIFLAFGQGTAGFLHNSAATHLRRETARCFESEIETLRMLQPIKDFTRYREKKSRRRPPNSRANTSRRYGGSIRGLFKNLVRDCVMIARTFPQPTQLVQQPWPILMPYTLPSATPWKEIADIPQDWPAHLQS